MKTTQQLRVELANSGLEHVSFSSIKEAINNPYLWHKKYVLRDFFFEAVSPANIVGKACHHGAEWYIQQVLQCNTPTVVTTIAEAREYAKNEIDKNRKHEGFFTQANFELMYGYGYGDLEPEAIIRELSGQAEMDKKLPEGISWGKTGSVSSVMQSIADGITNWYEAYTQLEESGYKPVASEQMIIETIATLDGNELILPVKGSVDAIFVNNDNEYICVDWKFKGRQSDDDNKADYDMQGCTYISLVRKYLSQNGVDDPHVTRCIFVEILTKQASFPISLKADLQAECQKNGIEYSDKDRVVDLQMRLLASAVVDMPKAIQFYTVDVVQDYHLIVMWFALYYQAVQMMIDHVQNGTTPFPNIFDGNFGGGTKCYKEWEMHMRQQCDNSTVESVF